MDLGYKTLNNLTSKDFSLQKQAAHLIVDFKDVKAFKILEEKSEFIFDFIKDKILKNLIYAVNKDNVLNLFDFMKVYSEDFKDFIIEPLIKYNSEQIEEKILNLLETGSDEEKTYAVHFYLKNKNEKAHNFAKEYIKSNYMSLRTAAIKLLYEYRDKEEFYKALKVIQSDKDDYEKMKAVEFLAAYGDKEGFDPVFNYLKENPTNEIIASNLLSMKDFRELISEDNQNTIFGIFSSLIWNFPDNITFEEINYYLEDGVLDYLLESDNDFAGLLLIYTKEKLEFAVSDEAYSIDFTKNLLQEAKNLIHQLNSMTDYINKDEIITISLNSKNKIKILISLHISDKNQKESVEKLALKSDDNEIKIACTNFLKEKGILESNFLSELEKTVKNETVKVLINSFAI